VCCNILYTHTHTHVLAYIFRKTVYRTINDETKLVLVCKIMLIKCYFSNINGYDKFQTRLSAVRKICKILQHLPLNDNPRVILCKKTAAISLSVRIRCYSFISTTARVFNITYKTLTNFFAAKIIYNYFRWLAVAIFYLYFG